MRMCEKQKRRLYYIQLADILKVLRVGNLFFSHYHAN